jgi:hypothetical protein
MLPSATSTGIIDLNFCHITWQSDLMMHVAGSKLSKSATKKTGTVCITRKLNHISGLLSNLSFAI